MKQAIVIEKLGYDKEVGDMCMFCLRSTGNENIPVCLNCIQNENFYHSLGILKQMLRDRRKTQTQHKSSNIINYNSCASMGARSNTGKTV